jgi:hypothetical protein
MQVGEPPKRLLSIEGVAPSFFEACAVSKWMENGGAMVYRDVTAVWKPTKRRKGNGQASGYYAGGERWGGGVDRPTDRPIASLTIPLI